MNATIKRTAHAPRPGASCGPTWRRPEACAPPSRAAGAASACREDHGFSRLITHMMSRAVGEYSRASLARTCREATQNFDNWANGMSPSYDRVLEMARRMPDAMRRALIEQVAAAAGLSVSIIDASEAEAPTPHGVVAGVIASDAALATALQVAHGAARDGRIDERESAEVSRALDVVREGVTRSQAAAVECARRRMRD